MRILVLGAGGFIGRHIVAELLAAGHDVVGLARSTKALAAAFPQATFVALDLARTINPEDWTIHLSDVDVVVNAAGLLRGPDMEAVHVDMPKALHEAAIAAAVRRVVLISAISARDDVATDYSVSKLAGEAALRSSGLDYTILRPPCPPAGSAHAAYGNRHLDRATGSQRGLRKPERIRARISPADRPITAGVSRGLAALGCSRLKIGRSCGNSNFLKADIIHEPVGGHSGAASRPPFG